MKHPIDHKVGLILLYTVATLVCIGALLYFVSSFRGLRHTQKELDEAHWIFERTNDLVGSLHEAQTFSEMYVTTRNPELLQSYHSVVDSVFQVVDILFVKLPEGQQNQLLALSDLFVQKEVLLQEISSRRDHSTPIQVRRDQPAPTHESGEQRRVESRVEVDTVFTTSEEERGFFRRIFSGKPQSTQVITIRQSDSIIHEHTESVQYAFSETIDTLLRTIEQSELNRQRQLQTLERQYIALLSADQQISQDISAVLIQLHKTALDGVVETLSQKDRSTQQVLFAGILAFLLVSAFVFVIFRSAQSSLRQSREWAEAKRITEELMHSRHQLLLSISHDIKAPLCSIVSYLEFWDKDDLSAEEIRQLSSMQNSATHILDMLTNLLEFSRLEQKKTQIQNQSIEPIPLFLEVADLFMPMANDKNLKFLYRFSNLDDCLITTDALKLRQITTNLISNAIKYTTQGEVQLYAELLNDPTRLKIVVSDTGIGIPQERLDTIFDPFTQIDNRSANVEGSGFGLFVVKGLVEAMNGTITVESSEKGTVFAVELPL